MENIKESKEMGNETNEEVIKELKPKKEVAKHLDEFSNKKDYKKILIIIAIILIVLLVLSTGFALVNANSENIMAGITINGVNVQGLSKEEAKVLIMKKVDEQVNNEVKIYVDSEEQTILLSQIEIIYDVENAVNEAYKVGRRKNIFVNNFEILKSKIFGTDIDLKIEYNEELLNNIIKNIKDKVPEPVTETTYCIEDEELIITRGKKGNTIN